jgi:hypothetical protein
MSTTPNADGDCPTCAAEGKPHFGWCSWKYLDNEPSVLGAGDGPAPMPTEEEMRSAYRSAYMSYMRTQGVPEDFAIQSADAIDWQLVKDEKLTPEEMAHAEMEQWSAD